MNKLLQSYALKNILQKDKKKKKKKSDDKTFSSYSKRTLWQTKWSKREVLASQINWK